MKTLLLVAYRLPLFVLSLSLAFHSFAAEPPTGLTTDLLEHTDRVFLDGYPANFSLEERRAAIERYRLTAIRSAKPYLGWIMNDARPNTLQTAYRILMASSTKLLAQNQGDMWDSGRTASDNSTAVQYAGKPLQPSTVYYWKVQTWSNHGEESPFSEPKSFITAERFDNRTACYPLQVADEYPVRMRRLYTDGANASANDKALVLVDGLESDLDEIDPAEVESFSVLKDAAATAVYGTRGANGVLLITTRRVGDGKKHFSARPSKAVFIDFGKAAFGRLRITLTSPKNDTVTVRMGEHVKDGRIDRKPGGTIRYASYKLPVMAGTYTYSVKIRPDVRNTSATANESGVKAILMPDDTGEVMPFRYCEIEGYYGNIRKSDVVRQSVYYPFNETASRFLSSDTVLNRVWELCKYSVKAVSFAGIYVDGDRERIPYEADALINQLCHYSVDREFAIARRSCEYFFEYATWPAEWIMQSVLMSWYDYLYTGNPASIERFYEDLKAKTLSALTETNGLISTRTGKLTPELMKSIHFAGKAIRDIVDWPQSGVLGIGKESPGEADGFVFTDYNTVVNAYHYEALKLISRIAEALGKTADRDAYLKQSGYVKQQFNKLLLDRKKGYYNDGIGTEHSALHSTMFPLAFGMAPAGNSKTATDYMRSRGMACSVYGSQFLMDAVYNANDAAYGLQLLSSTAERSWYNMIRAGSTISLEAWDNKYKPNQDWNHAWGAAPANVIPRRLMGVEPLEPGFRKIRIKPQPATLAHAELVMPTIRGDVKVSFRNTPGTKFEMEIEIPANTVAEVWLPLLDRKQRLTMDGAAQKGIVDGSFVKLQAGSGKRRFVVEN
ncbi:MAG: family 78 glycoside hydrolase catalytic domain [Bacteroidales bacterium]|jgi:TonB-dependent SusC/RagA subfamily outer membrane receptor|nr:family 78 glycoside hydrolase catalytic domain [Bacteroidales bacterium]